ncbi:MAG TPA: SCP2 sterol-binding domain-containing protein [Myxococcota bacterium]|nr:SCP2 sterol-binding domain-containing protein [Myxococcota bacterium]
MAKFLSREWFSEVERIVAQVSPPIPDAIKDLVINFRIKGGPQGDVEARMAGGRFQQGFGAGAPTTVNVPFEVARKMIVDNDQNAAMQAFMSGQIQVEGDMGKIMMMQAAGPPSPENVKVGELIRGMTE